MYARLWPRRQTKNVALPDTFWLVSQAAAPSSVAAVPAAADDDGASVDSLDSLDSGDEGGVLAQLRAARLDELRRKEQSQKPPQRRRLPVSLRGVTEVATDTPDVLAALVKECLRGGRALVAHLPAQGVSASDEVDEELAALATLAGDQGALFVRLPQVRGGGRAADAPLLAVLGATPSLVRPSVASVVDGVCAVAAGYAPFGGVEELQVSRVRRWLRRAGALEAANDESDGESSEEEAECESCAICGRTYKHEHVRSLTTSGLANSTLDSDED